MITCAHPDRIEQARGLCQPCYDAAKWRGELDNYPLTRVRATICAVVDCQKAPRSGAYCRMHQTRLERTGSLDLTPRPTPEDRFWSQVEKSDGCWLWQGLLDAAGYGRPNIHRRRQLAHRFAYTELVGPIPDGLPLDHLCRVRNCVNPAHLEPVTTGENNRRAWVIRKLNHPFDLTKCGTDAGYKRHRRAGIPPCEPCLRAQNQARRARERAAS